MKKLIRAVVLSTVSLLALAGCTFSPQAVRNEGRAESAQDQSKNQSQSHSTVSPQQTSVNETEVPIPQENYVDRLIVRYSEGLSPLNPDGTVRGTECLSNVQFTDPQEIGFGFFTITFMQPASQNVASKIVQNLLVCPGIASAEVDQSVSLSATDQPQQAEEDLKSPEGAQSVQATANSGSWGLDRIDQRNLPLNGAYQYDTTGNNVRVYVIDTGVSSSHQELAGRVEYGYDGVGDGSGTSDCNGHGTHVSGIIAGTTYGVAKTATIVPIRVLNCAGQEASSSAIIQGLSWLVNNHQAGTPAVANMSLAMNASNAVDFAVRQVISDGVTVVVASGNSGALSGLGNACLYSPARVTEAITVNASTTNDDDATFSNFGSCADLYAPGTNIVSASILSSTSVSTKSGTSMAAPHVAGAVARILGMNPSLTPAQVQHFIKTSATYVDFGLGSYGDPNLLLFIDPFASNANYVRNLYKDFLSRAATQFEVDYWSQELDSGRTSPSRLTALLATSDEWIQTIIRGFYVDTLGREPDSSGYQYWIDRARNGMPIADIGSFFYGSDEYFQSFGQSNNSVWLSDLYQKLMLRSADQSGLNFWLQQISSGQMSRPAIAHWFYQSPEKLGLRVDYLYSKLLSRSSDPGGRAYWANRLKDEGDLSLASQLAISGEYFSRRYANE